MGGKESRNREPRYMEPSLPGVGSANLVGPGPDLKPSQQMSFGKGFREFMRDKRISQKRVAASLEVTQGYVSQILRRPLSSVMFASRMISILDLPEKQADELRTLATLEVEQQVMMPEERMVREYRDALKFNDGIELSWDLFREISSSLGIELGLVILNLAAAKHNMKLAISTIDTIVQEVAVAAIKSKGAPDDAARGRLKEELIRRLGKRFHPTDLA